MYGSRLPSLRWDRLCRDDSGIDDFYLLLLL